MSRLFYSLLLILFCYTLAAQIPYKSYNFHNPKTGKVAVDSIIGKLKKERAYQDSIYYTRKIDSLELLFNHINTDTIGYNALTLSLEYVSAEYDKLLDDLLANGFSDVGSGATAFGYGFTLKRKRFIHEYTFNIIFGHKMKSDNKNEEVNVTGLNLLNYVFGFDVLNAKRVNLFPFIGINHQFTTLQYKKNYTSGSYTSLFDIGNDAADIDIEKSSLRFTLGAEFDYHVSFSERQGGIILGVRYGINNTLTEGPYKVDHKKVDYDPEISLRDTYVTFLLKIYGRRQYKVKWY